MIESAYLRKVSVNMKEDGEKKKSRDEGFIENKACHEGELAAWDCLCSQAACSHTLVRQFQEAGRLRAEKTHTIRP